MKNNSISAVGPEGGDNAQSNTRSQSKRSVKTKSKITLAAVALALVVVARSSLRGDDENRSHGNWRQLVIDVAEDARTAVPPVSGPPPKRGDTLIENGKIFSGGTIPAGDGFDIDTTGSIGTFVSRGTFNFDFSQAFSGGDPLISSTDQYLFSLTGALNVEDSLMIEGQDSFLSTTHRVVVGGTGIYRGTIGEVKVEVLGRNSTGFVNRRLTFQIRTRE